MAKEKEETKAEGGERKPSLSGDRKRNRRRRKDIEGLKAKMREMDYDDYWKKMERKVVRIVNDFAEYLLAKGLSENTVSKHLWNIETFLETYQIGYEETGTVFNGWNDFESYFYWFERKCSWANVTYFKGTITAFKKFYKFLYEEDYIDSDELNEALSTIKNGSEDWLDEFVRRQLQEDLDFQRFITGQKDWEA